MSGLEYTAVYISVTSVPGCELVDKSVSESIRMFGNGVECGGMECGELDRNVEV